MSDRNVAGAHASPAGIAAAPEALSAEAPARPEPRSRLKRTVMLFGAMAAVGAAVQQGYLTLETLTSVFSTTKPLAASAKNPETPPAEGKSFRPTDTQWQTLGVEPVTEATFRTTLTTDGKIVIDEDHTTPVFSPYAGRVLKLFAKPGERIEKGKPLFTIEASDMVQGQNDFLAARATLNKAKSQLDVATVVLKRHRDLVLANAVAKRELEQAEIGFVAAQNDLKAGEVALEAARNRLRILGKTDAEIQGFEQGRQPISAETIVNSPLSGTIVQRKVGPGQFVAGASNDPVFVIGDLSTVWLIANVRETDATKVTTEQPLEFTILAQPDRIYRTKVSYIASSVNPDTHRLQVRAEIENPEGQLRPEMFANVSIVIGQEQRSPRVPRHAIIYEGDAARVWVVRADRSIELRPIVVGITAGQDVQVVSGLRSGEQIIVRGSLFIDRLAAPAVSERE